MEPRHERIARMTAVAEGMTWYDILGISPGASSETIRRAYEDKARQLGPDRIAGAPAEVVAAAARGRQVIESAWLVLGDHAGRARYDEQAGFARAGTGLARPAPTPSRPGLDPADAVRAADALGSADALNALDALADLLGPVAPSPRRSRHVVVPDVRGLFSGACQDAAAKAGLRIRMVRLIEHPMPTEGLIIDQSPRPGERVDRSSTLTVHVWHPSRPS
jgi:curved DNA-binding protein CbpA